MLDYARKKAIQKMFDVYEAAHWTIVLDADLMANNVGTDYLEPAMRITMSGWMQRLWTLQEGVMSRSIFFLFEEGLKDIEELELLYPEAVTQVQRRTRSKIPNIPAGVQSSRQTSYGLSIEVS
jgi:hypothetical protein